MASAAERRSRTSTLALPSALALPTWTRSREASLAHLSRPLSRPAPRRPTGASAWRRYKVLVHCARVWCSRPYADVARALALEPPTGLRLRAAPDEQQRTGAAPEGARVAPAGNKPCRCTHTRLSLPHHSRLALPPQGRRRRALRGHRRRLVRRCCWRDHSTAARHSRQLHPATASEGACARWCPCSAARYGVSSRPRLLIL